jgi:hypothetical protein
MEYCSRCRSFSVRRRELGADEKVVRKSYQILDTVTVHECTVFRCPAKWYKCDQSCRALRRVGNTTKTMVFHRRSTLKRHLEQKHDGAICKAAEPDNDPGMPVDDQELPDEPQPYDHDQVQDQENPVRQEDSANTHVTPQSYSSLKIYPAPRKTFVSDSLNQHLENCTKHGYYEAVCRIVSRSACQEENASVGSVPSPWLFAFLSIARIVLLSNGEVHALLSSLTSFMYMILSFFLEKLRLLPDLPLPLSVCDYTCMILNTSNTHSLKSILPIPHFSWNAKTEHTILSPTELVPMVLFMPPMASSKNGLCDRYRSTIKSESFFEKRNKVPLQYRSDNAETPAVLVYITLWSDGWDPNKSSKNNRSPVWSATGTMIFAELGSEDTPFLAHTVLLGVGASKNTSHEEFFEMLVKEKTTKWEDCNGQLVPFSLFSRLHDKKVNVFITIALALQDNPERRQSAMLLAGNSNTHGAFSLSCDFRMLAIPFVACSDCQERTKQYLRNSNLSDDCVNHECTKCLGFSIDKLCSKGVYKEQIGGMRPPLRPDEFGYELTIKPGRITFEDNIRAWEYATKMFIERKWRVGRTRAYLKLFCCNDELQQRFVLQGRTYLQILDSMEPGAEQRYLPEMLLRLRTMHANLTDHLPKHPAIWLLLSILDITETPMHLMMGIIKCVIRTLLRFTSSIDKQQDFIKRCNEVLKTASNLRIELLPLIEFKDFKFGGYVAENYAAFAMVLPWLSHILSETIMERPELCPVPDPATKPVASWSGRECKAWLAERGVKGYSVLTASDARDQVVSFLSLPLEKQPRRVVDMSKELPFTTIRQFLLTANSLFSTIMLRPRVKLSGA